MEVNSVFRTTCMLGLIACFAAIGGCFHPTIEDGGFACDPTLVPACPSGFFCVDGRCRTSPNPDGSGNAGGSGSGGGGGSGGNGGGGTAVGDLAMSGPADMSHFKAPPDLATAGDSCSHDICTSGTKLTNGCDACVTQICAQDDYCCTTKWSSQCVTEVGTICNQSCP
jgi:hypothetical protein